MFENYNKAKEQILQYLADCVSQARELDMPLIANQLEQCVLDIRTLRFNIAVVGDIKRGKSTLLNVLLGQDSDQLSPVASEVCTGGIIHYMDLSCLPEETEPHARVFTYGRQQPERVALEEVRNYITEEGNPGNERQVSRVEIYGNFPLLHSCSLVDTPGANAVIERHGDMVYDFLPRADAIIMTVMAGQPVTSSEAAMLKALAADAQRRVFYVLTKVDAENPRDLPEICHYMKGKIAEQGLVAPDTIYKIAARPVFEARCSHKPQEEIDSLRQQWGVADLERTLESFILKSSGGGRLLVKRVREATQKARQAFNDKKKANEALIETQDVNKEELQKEKQRLLAEFDRLKKGLEKKLASFSHQWDGITERSIAGLETLVPRLEAELETRIDSAHMVTSIKNAFQLGSLIRTAVRPTLEDYIEKRAAQYEKLIATLDEVVQ